MGGTEQEIRAGTRATVTMPDEETERLHFVRAVTHHLAEGVAAMDREGNILFLNRAGERMLGWSEAELAGRVVHDAVHYQHADGSPYPGEECPMRETIMSGKTVKVDNDVFTRRDGTIFPAAYVCSPIYSGERIVGAALAFRDTSERVRAQEAERRAQEQLEFLAQASIALASSLDYTTTLAQVGKLAVPRLADWCVIDVVDLSGRLQRVATAHIDPEKIRLAEELGARYPSDPNASTGVAEVIRTGRSELYPEISDEMLVQSAHDQIHLELLRSLGLKSVMIVPLTARGRTFGAITLVSSESSHVFDEDDLSFAQHLARRSAVAVDNAKLYSDSAKIAQTLQQSLLPPHLPRIYGVETAARYHFAGQGNEVGGDFYDVFRTGRRRWTVVVGDVCGKGAEAAAVTGLARHTIRAAAMQVRSPSRMLAMLNEAIIGAGRADDRFCTVVLGSLERSSDGIQVSIACGGHPAPIVVRADGTVKQMDCRGTLLGVFPDPSLADVKDLLAPGDAIVFFTDGVTEARKDNEIFGIERLLELLSGCRGFSAAEIAERVERAALAFQHPVVRDDIAILALKVTA